RLCQGHQILRQGARNWAPAASGLPDTAPGSQRLHHHLCQGPETVSELPHTASGLPHTALESPHTATGLPTSWDIIKWYCDSLLGLIILESGILIRLLCLTVLIGLSNCHIQSV